MPRFKDNKGREWVVEVTVAAVKRVRSLTGVDLLDIESGALLRSLLGDPIALVDVLYAVCQPAAAEIGVDDGDFGEALAGDAVASATDALIEGLVGFFPSPKDRENWAAVLQRTRAVIDSRRDLAAEQIRSGAVERAIEEALDLSGAPSTSSPGSSGSTPAPSPSGS